MQLKRWKEYSIMVIDRITSDTVLLFVDEMFSHYNIRIRTALSAFATFFAVPAIFIEPLLSGAEHSREMEATRFGLKIITNITKVLSLTFPI